MYSNQGKRFTVILKDAAILSMKLILVVPEPKALKLPKSVF
ncbi:MULTISPECIES: hypothetical protein [Pseudanabaena]|nr:MULTISPECIES: hypothetical protein [Pseudanabaena]MEA5487033.1 hypothetical protein [Pseudanabaena sp. CCNP1317]WGS71756.1 hypothetical protein OA858_18930 [Pseudanabaena galeata CCNP1313]